MTKNKQFWNKNFAKSADFCKKMPFFAIENRKCLIDSLSLSLSLSLSNILIYHIFDMN